MVMSCPVSSSTRGLRIVFVVDVVGPFGGGGGEELEIVSVEGGLDRWDVFDIVLFETGGEKEVLDWKVRCWI